MTHLQVAQRLIDQGFQAFMVGGAVRDQFFNQIPKDFDIATDANPDSILRIFPEGKQIGMHFPVVLVDDVEVATFRTEIARGRHDVDVTLVKTIEEDLARRDFTINAIAIDMKTDEIIDPFNGRDDIRKNALRFVGNSISRINEDPVRMLRAVRFISTFGLIPDFDAISSIRAASDKIKQISSERIRMELEKMLKLENPMHAFSVMHKFNILNEIFPEFSRTHIGQNHFHHETVFEHSMLALEFAAKMRTSNDLVFRMAAFLHDIGKPATNRFDDEKNDVTFHGHEMVGAAIARKMLKRLTFDNETIDKIVFLIKEHMFFFDESTRLSRVKVRMNAANELGLNIRDLMRIRIVDRRANLAKRNRSKITKAFKRTLRNIRKIEATDAALKVTDLEINGYDLIKLGFEPGRIFKDILNAVLEEVLEERLENNRDVQIKFIEENFIKN